MEQVILKDYIPSGYVTGSTVRALYILISYSKRNALKLQHHRLWINKPVQLGDSGSVGDPIGGQDYRWSW